MNIQEEKYTSTWTSAAQALYNALQYTNKKQLSLTEVMGYTSHAFRINIHPDDVNIAGPTSFNAGAVQQRALMNIGVESEELAFGAPATPEQLERLIAFAQDSIDRGVPVIGWDLFIPEFGLIYGYDDAKKVLLAKDVSKDGEIRYEHFGDIRTDIHWVLRLTKTFDKPKERMLYDALAMILEHTFNRETYPFSEMFDAFKYGISGYDAWINAFEKGTVDPLGNAYNSEVVSCAREFAAHFLHQLKDQWTDNTHLVTSINATISEAAAHYDEVAKHMVVLRDMFPFPGGGKPNEPELRDRALKCLKQARQYEHDGAMLLQSMYEKLRDELSAKK